MNVQQIKQRFGIIGDAPLLNRALEVAAQVAPTDISVLVAGESGTGKEIIPQVIHQLSARKHGEYIAVNCGAIPEGTIDSELFGHEKGSFTGASGSRLGYFEVANGGTIFLDEVAELPMQTQVRLLRVLETGEFMRVGASKVIKTNVRVVAATNENMMEAISSGKFREDLYYRLSTVPIQLPALRDRKEDIHLLFRKFASDFGQKYKMPTIRLSEEAVQMLKKYRWPGNIRQLRNIAEQISVLESSREVNGETLQSYLPHVNSSQLPAVIGSEKQSSDFSNEREILYKVLFDMKGDLNDLKKLTLELLKGKDGASVQKENDNLIRKIYGKESQKSAQLEALSSYQENEDNYDEEAASDNHYESLPSKPILAIQNSASEKDHLPDLNPSDKYHFAEEIEEEETLSLHDKEIELIIKALERNKGKRKLAASELGISERTLYRKIKQYDL